MKAVILAGGLGTRLSEESHLRPKPMVEIGNLPIIVHIMKLFAFYDVKDFIICASYKQQMIKEYFAHYFLYTNDITFHTSKNEKTILTNNDDDWNVTVVDTGLNTQTGGRIKRVAKYLDDGPFLLTYGDAVGDVNIDELIEFHKRSNKLGTISVYNFGQSKGVVDINKKGDIAAFREKSDLDGDLINIGFMVMEKEVIDLIPGDSSPFEDTAIQELVKRKQLNGYLHNGFWQCMDTINEKKKLEELYMSGNAPWKVWKD